MRNNPNSAPIPPRSSGGVREGQALKRIFAVFAVTALALLALISCSEDRTTESYETHPTNWMDEYSPDWHGTAALPNKGENCGSCHVLYVHQPSGPTSNYFCRSCHEYPHGADYTDHHVTEIRFNRWQNLPACQECHGVDFAGGRSGASCNECHVQPAGPAACNTCHGTPPSTSNPLGTNNPGAHDAHTRYACTECHNSVNGLDHIDILPADVAFGDARISNANGYPASYTSPSNCATWCHSNLHQGAPIVPVSWNTGQSLNACRSCHQIPPSAPFHPTGNQCHLCHPNIDPSSNYNDANLIRFLPGDTLHVNGVVNALFQ